MSFMSTTSDDTELISNDTESISNNIEPILNYDNNSINIFNKRTCESEVWEYFKKIIWEKERKTAKCMISNCKHKEFSCGNGGTTKPLWRHFESTYWTQYILTKEYYKKKKCSRKIRFR